VRFWGRDAGGAAHQSFGAWFSRPSTLPYGMVFGTQPDVFGDSPVSADTATRTAHTAPSHTATLSSAGFWRRLVAFSIDGNLIVLLRLALSLVWSGTMWQPTSAIAGAVPLFLVVFSSLGLLLAWGLTGLVYYAAFEASPLRATPGKIIMQSYVGASDGGAITFARALGRNLAKIFSVITFGLGYLMAAFTGRKQALHDLIAGTVVYRHANATAVRFLLGILCALLLGAITGEISPSIAAPVDSVPPL
jgi:uncharacterized RDD family membrane protein YckC